MVAERAVGTMTGRKKLSRYEKAKKTEVLGAKEMKEKSDTESDENDDNKFEKKKDMDIKHHASCMNSAAMENAYNICHNVQVIIEYTVQSKGSSGSHVL